MGPKTKNFSPRVSSRENNGQQKAEGNIQSREKGKSLPDIQNWSFFIVSCAKYSIDKICQFNS